MGNSGIWILTVIIYTHSGAGIESTEYNGKQSCVSAAEVIKSAFSSKGNLTFTCTSKG